MALFGRLFGRGYQKKPGGGYDVGPGKKAARDFGRPLFGKPVATPAGKPVAVPQPITLGRSTPPTGQRTTVGVPHAEAYIEPFLSGTVLNVTSSVIDFVTYDRPRQELTIHFLGTTSLRTTTYEDVTESEAAGFYHAPSKGGWWHDVCLGPGWRPGHGTAKRWHFA